ncbi:hypothetical protein BD770DRAFT_404230 [Pilaira anomala]|nr:hypothetical protein BD770DRAFT_404230 [Pilaira anomala]
MKADNWKSWCLILNFFIKDVLPRKHMEHWMKFVNACRYILKPTIHKNNFSKAHKLFLDFKIGCSELYGKSSLSMNHYLHAHLKQAT